MNRKGQSMLASRRFTLSLILLALFAMPFALQGQTVTTFEGLDASQLLHPQQSVDPDGSVGTKQFMEYVNVYYQAYDKVTFAPVFATPQPFVTPFQAAGLTNCNSISGNGTIIFDRLASRWVMGAHTSTTNSYYYCIAVSNTDDLSSASLKWFAYAIPLNTILGMNSHGNVYFPDWPRLGTWPDAYYLSIDLNDPNNNFAEVGVVACALDRTNMLTGGVPNPPQCFENPTSINGSVYLAHSMIPADVQGTVAPPTGRDEYMLSIQNPPLDKKTTTSTSLNLWTFHVDWVNPLNTTFTQSSLTVPSYSPACYLVNAPTNTACVPESTTGTTHVHIDSVGDRLEPHLSYRNFGAYESFLASHTVLTGAGSSKQTGIRWYELRGAGTPTLFQSGTVSPDTSLFRFLPSISQDTDGNAAVGYSVSNSTTHPGINSSWWNTATPATSTELSLFAGAGDQENNTKWGSYTSMTVDPIDGCTFWYVNQYYATNQTGTSINWNTRVSNFKIPTCGTVTIAPASINFGQQTTGITSAPQIVTLTNSQTVALNISGVGFTGANSGDFAQTNTCGSSLAAAQACTISVTFTPTATGARTATLNVTDDAGNSPQSVSLSGTGINPTPILVITPSSINFGNQVVGTTSNNSPINVSNTGTAAATFTSIGLTGTNIADFGQTNNCLPSLPAGQSCTINATFSPAATGSFSAAVTLIDNAPNSPQNVPLSGTGVQPVTLSTSNIGFGTVLVGSSKTAPNVTLTNNQSVALTGITIVASPAVFTQTNTCGTTIPALGTCTITITFTPTTGGSLTGNVTINDSASNSPQIITLKGAGLLPVSFTPVGLNFGNQLVGTTSNPKVTVLSNNMKVALSITSITITGTDAGDFAQTNDCGTSVAAGGTCNITVTFTPTAKGTRTASITATDSAVTSPQNASLTGNGK